MAVLYLASPSTPQIREAMVRGLLGMINTPANNHILPDGVPWGADSGCFSKGYPGDAEYLQWLTGKQALAATCAFATAPDVVGDAIATMERSRPFLTVIRDLGYPVALVGQNGLEDLAVPWDDIDALFIGGDTNWKLGPHARALVREAKERGKWVHMGRVNSAKRLRYADHVGCDSADGTYLRFGPDVNLPNVRSWVRSVNDQGVLWEAS